MGMEVAMTRGRIAAAEVADVETCMIDTCAVSSKIHSWPQPAGMFFLARCCRYGKAEPALVRHASGRSCLRTRPRTEGCSARVPRQAKRRFYWGIETRYLFLLLEQDEPPIPVDHSGGALACAL